MCTCPRLDSNHIRFIKCNTDKKRPGWMNKQNLQSHLSYHHDRFPIKKGDKLKNAAVDQSLVDLKESMNVKLALFFADNNISHLTIQSKSFQEVLQFAMDIGGRVLQKKTPHEFKKITKFATLSRSALSTRTEKMVGDAQTMISEFLSDFYSEVSNSTTEKKDLFISVDVCIDAKGFGRRHANGMTLIVTKLQNMKIEVYSFVFSLTRNKAKEGKTSLENAEALKQFTTNLLGNDGNNLKSCGDAAVVITNSTILSDSLKKESNCKAMALVLDVCKQHGYQLSMKGSYKRTIVDTNNKKYSKEQFSDAYSGKKCKLLIKIIFFHLII